MPNSEYLNTSLARQLKEVHERLTFAARRHEILAYNLSIIHSLIPEINRLERIVNALESIGVNLDEEDICALEGIAKDKDLIDCEVFRDKINETIGTWQEEQREYEQESAIEALADAGFVQHDEDGETWTKGDVTVKIELVNGWESRYKWEYESGPDDDFPPLNSLAPIRCASGLSGEFHRLLNLIGSGNENNASTGADERFTRVVK